MVRISLQTKIHTDAAWERRVKKFAILVMMDRVVQNPVVVCLHGVPGNARSMKSLERFDFSATASLRCLSDLKR